MLWRNQKRTQLKLRDWPMFQPSSGKGNTDVLCLMGGRFTDIRPVMSHVGGSPSEKLRWLEEQEAAGKLEGDDPDEIAGSQSAARDAHTRERVEGEETPG